MFSYHKLWIPCLCCSDQPVVVLQNSKHVPSGGQTMQCQHITWWKGVSLVSSSLSGLYKCWHWHRQSANNIGRRYIGRAVAEFGKVCSHAVLHSLCKLRGTRVKQLDLFFSKTLSKTELKKSSNCSHNLEYWVYVNTLIAIFLFLRVNKRHFIPLHKTYEHLGRLETAVGG